MNTVLLDFDGVIRFWTGSEIKSAERTLGLDEGCLLRIAFSDHQLLPAITGAISDEKWRSNVKAELAEKFSSECAESLISAWNSATYEIDLEFIKSIKCIDRKVRLVLISNATSKLDADLRAANLASFIDLVVNSSSIGVAKPDIRYFERVLDIAERTPQECLYIDDSSENVDTAIKMGIRSELYTNSDKALQFVKNEILI